MAAPPHSRFGCDEQDEAARRARPKRLVVVETERHRQAHHRRWDFAHNPELAVWPIERTIIAVDGPRDRAEFDEVVVVVAIPRREPLSVERLNEKPHGAGGTDRCVGPPKKGPDQQRVPELQRPQVKQRVDTHGRPPGRSRQAYRFRAT